MSSVRRLVRALSVVVAVLLGGGLVLILALAALLVWTPSWLINEGTLAFAVGSANRWTDLSLTYDEADVVVRSESWRSKSIDLALANVCFRLGQVDGCLERADLSVGIDLMGRPVLLSRIGPMIIEKGKIILTSDAREKPRPSTAKKDPRRQLEKLRETRIEALRASGLELEIRTTSEDGRRSVIAAAIALETRRLTRGRLEGDFWLTKGSGMPLKEMGLSVVVEELDRPGAGLPPIAFEADGVLDPVGEFEIEGELGAWREDKRTLSLEASLDWGPRDVEARLVGEIRRTGIVLHPTLRMSGIHPGLAHVELRDCRVTGPYPADPAEAGYLTFHRCLVDLVRGRFVEEERLVLPIPREASFAITGTYSYFPSEGMDAFAADAKIDLIPIDTGTYRFDGAADLVAEGRFGDLDRATISVGADASLAIERFETLVARLDRTPWAIPAPLNTLEGSIDCKLKGAVMMEGGTAALPMACVSNLQGADQILALEGKGRFRVQRRDDGLAPLLDLDIALRDVRVVLPHFRINEGVPSLKGDSRFRERIVPQEERPSTRDRLPMSYRIRVATRGKPVRVILRQAEGPIPIEMNLVVTSETGVSGSLDIGRFEIDVLKKLAIIDHFDFRFRPNEPPGLAGKIIVEQAEYDIHLAFFGTTAQPRIDITSVPPRAESEIMANLLYGQSLDELDPERQRSVAETRAAFAEGAIGLISMFYLASTPIESIGYNPHTGEFHARVKVHEGLALEVGSDFEGQRRVGLSKRLGRNWSFETFALTSDGKDGAGQRGVAMLRWARRY